MRPIKLSVVRAGTTSLMIALAAAAGCGDPSGGTLGTGGTGGNPSAQTSYALSCTIGMTTLEIPIDLSYSLDRPYTAGGSVNLTFASAVTFDEPTTAALIEAGIRTIDIISLQITSPILGATPGLLEAFLAAAPINDFDLEPDTDENGAPGPHRIELDTVTRSSSVVGNAQEVEMGLGLDQVSLVLGDFDVPSDCLRPALIGFSVRFPVVAAD